MMTDSSAEAHTSRSGDNEWPASIFYRSFSTCELLMPTRDKPDARKMSFALNFETGAWRRCCTFRAGAAPRQCRARLHLDHAAFSRRCANTFSEITVARAEAQLILVKKE